MLSPDLQRIEHIRDYCIDIEKAVQNHHASFEEFEADIEFQYSMSFCILQIGELAKGLSDEFVGTTSDQIPWRKIRGMRNLVAHGYGSMSHDIIWTTITTSVPELRENCEKLLDKQN